VGTKVTADTFTTVQPHGRRITKT